MSDVSLSIYPWQKELWSQILKREQNQRMPHALLFAGPEEIGKQAFAEHLANYMVCRKKGIHPCGGCKDCLLFQAGTHPDVMHVMPEDKHRQIRIQQVRNIVDFLACRSNQGGYRVVIVCPAEDMNMYAANALLKSLEEPGDNTLIVLVSQRPESLLPTIRSRCQQVSFSLPPSLLAMEWLNDRLSDRESAASALMMAQGRPLAALRYVRDHQSEKWALLEQGLKAILRCEKSLAEVSESWKSLDLVFVLQWLIQRVASMVRYKMTGDVSYLQVACQSEEMISLIQCCGQLELVEFHDWLVKHYGQAAGQINFNAQLLVEALLVRWQNLSLS